MKITADELTVLKAISEQIMLSGNFPARHRKTILMVTVNRQIYDRFDREGTIASILTEILYNVERGAPLYNGVLTSDVAPPAPPKPAENDPFTEEALRGIPPGKPDSSILNPPGATMEGGDGYFPPAETPKEGDIWVDANGRRWTIREGKKKQLPKVKPKEETDGNSG